MIIVNHQEGVEIFKKKNQAIEIVQYSHAAGEKVSIFIQPENIELFCSSLNNIILDTAPYEIIK